MRWLGAISHLLFIGCCALALMLQTRALLDQPLQPGLLDGVVLGGSVFGYYSAHPDWQRRFFVWTMGTAGGVCLVVWLIRGGNVILVLVPALAWLSYYGFRKPGNAGLRTIPMAKPITVAFAWAWVTVVLPAAPHHWDGLIPIFLERSTFIFALALAYDATDASYDRLYGLNTLAQTLHMHGTLRLINHGFLLAGFLVVWSFAKGIYNLSTATLLIFSLIFSAWWIRFLLHKNAWQPWHKILIDALMPLQCALVLLLR